MQIAWHIAEHGSPIIFVHLEMNSASQKISKILVFEKALQMAYLGAERPNTDSNSPMTQRRRRVRVRRAAGG
jgi:hypothetical protein